MPCSLIEDLIAVLERGEHGPYVTAVREDAAVGVAAGAWFGGRRPAVLMQNSGLGTCLNALASLSTMYGLPALLVITWRGWEGRDAPEHLLTGAITPQLLELLGIPFRVLGANALDDDLAWAATTTTARSLPVALLVPPRVVEAGREASDSHAARARAHPAPGPTHAGARSPLAVPTLTRLAAVATALKAVGDAPVIHANGYICRESFAVADRPESFYMIGSMGLAPAIGLGLALASPARPSVVFDGDGNLLMNLGILPMIASQRPANLVHVVFDNEVYGSTGSQRSLSQHVRLDHVAAAAGIPRVAAVTEAAALDEALRTALVTPGPHFVLVKVTPDEADVPRIPYSPTELRDRFRACCA